VIPLHDDNPSERPPIVTVTFIVACCLVFFWELSLGDQVQTVFFKLGVIPASLVGGQSMPAELAIVPAWTTVFTSMFMHGGWMHLIGNMLYLWIFGNNVEDVMGHARYVVFYLLCGAAAVFAQALPNPDSVTPMIGASGAISGVLGAYLLLFPKAQVLVVIPLGFILPTARVPAAFVLIFWFVLQLISSLAAGGEEGGVAFGAHIGGFVVGMALIPLFRQKRVPLHLFGKRF
jgi:membrane associated rhomboid family serine protease